MPAASKIRLTDEQKQVIYGTVIGDSSITINGKLNARLQMNHGFSQVRYVYWKYTKLQLVCSRKSFSFKKVDSGSYAYKKRLCKVRLQTLNSPDITEIYKMLRSGDKPKVVTREFLELLEPLAIAVWYCDDGGLTGDRRQIQLNTHSMTKEEVNIIIAYLKEKWKIEAQLQCAESPETEGLYYYFLCIYGQHAQEFLKLIVPEMPVKSMLYKTLLNFISNVSSENWDSYLETQYVPKFFKSKEEFKKFVAFERNKTR